MDGQRDILGLWVGPTGGESPKFWFSVMTDLKNRGVVDVLILCCDGLKGLPDAARATWPMVDVQLCVVHLVRNSLRYASKKHWGPITKQLKAIYTAPSLGAAEIEFDEFADEWEDLYPAMIKSWRDTWEDFIPFLEFPVELRKIVYSTNAIESLNARFRKAAVRRACRSRTNRNHHLSTRSNHDITNRSEFDASPPRVAPIAVQLALVAGERGVVGAVAWCEGRDDFGTDCACGQAKRQGCDQAGEPREVGDQ